MMNDRPTALTSSEVIRHSKADPIAPKVRVRPLVLFSFLLMKMSQPVFKVPSSPTLTDDSVSLFH